MSAVATITPQSLLAYEGLPASVRSEAWLWHERFTAIADSKQKRNPALRALAENLDVPFRTVRNDFYTWEAEGRDWRACANWSRARRKAETLTSEFVNWWTHFAGKNQRGTQAAFRAFGEAWKAGNHIPGLNNSLPRHTLPPGCTANNLRRYVKRSDFAITAMRRGLGVAKSHGPLVLTTRKGLWCGSHITLDDLFHDNFVMFQGQLVRVLQLSVLDVYSGAVVGWGCKPRQLRDDGKFDNLKERFARLLLADYFARHGYSKRGTEILSEHGTAALSDLFKAILRRHTGGKVTVRESGITGKEQALYSLGLGKGGGNFRHKSWLESLHNLFHNQLAALPGQTGRDVEHRPEFTHGQLVDDQNLIRAARWLAKTAPDLVQKLQTRLLHYHGDFLPLLGGLVNAINLRGTDPEIWTHNLEGWSDCGHIVGEYRFSANSSDWLNDAELRRMEPAAREAFIALCAARPELIRERKLSPHEIWTPGCRDLCKFPGVAIAEMLGEDYAREERVENMCFRFQDSELAPEALQYESRILTSRGYEEELPSGETYKLLLNPFNLDTIYIHDARGTYLGEAKRMQRSMRTDLEGVQDQHKRGAQRIADVLAPIRRADIADLAAETRRVKANTDLLAGELARLGIKTPRQVRGEQREQERAEQPAKDAADRARNYEGGDVEDFVTGGQHAVTVEEDGTLHELETLL